MTGLNKRANMEECLYNEEERKSQQTQKKEAEETKRLLAIQPASKQVVLCYPPLADILCRGSRIGGSSGVSSFAGRVRAVPLWTVIS